MGGGHAHLAVLESWIKKRPAGFETILVTPEDYTVYSGMVPGWIEGHYKETDVRIELEQLAKLAGVTLILEKATALDADASTLTLSSGKTLEYDYISLATGGRVDFGQGDFGNKHMLPIRPMDKFIENWSEITHLKNKPSSVALIGGGAAGIELAIAIKLALKKKVMQSQVNLIVPADSFLSSHNDNVRQLAKETLNDHDICHIGAMAEIVDGKLKLSDEKSLEPDVIIAATGSKAPRWIGDSGLAQDEAGFVAISADLRSISHTKVFAAGDISAHPNPKVVRSGVHAVMSGPVLAKNLRAAMRGAPTRPYKPKFYSLYLLSTGNKRAILSWGPIALHARWLWRAKDFIDRRFVTRYAKLANKA